MIPIAWVCSELSATSTQCLVTATTTDNVVTYRDWLFVQGVIIFILFIIVSMFIMSVFKRQ